MPAAIKHLTAKKVCYNSLLARWKDGLYYTAALLKCDKAKKVCRVCFEDGSEITVSNREVHLQLSIDQLSEDEDIVCCICDDGNSEPPNEIILCDVCQQGYHQKCHIPPVDSSKLDASEDTKDHKDWFCATCSYILNQTNRAKLGATVSQQQQPQQQHQPQPQQPKQTQSQPQTQGKANVATTPPHSSKSRPPPPASVPVVAPKIAATAELRTPIVPRQPPKVKQTPTISQPQKSSVGPVKPPVGAHQRSAPYYPLSNQVRAAVASSSSTAALASMTASSALVVGSTAGRSKQDLVKQSNRTVQRPASEMTMGDSTVLSPPKHAVRKSGINFVVTPVKQSALPTATRSVPSPGSAVHNGPYVKDPVSVPAIQRPPPTIISTQTGTLSVLTSPIRQPQQQLQQHQSQSMKQPELTTLTTTSSATTSATPSAQQREIEHRPKSDIVNGCTQQQSSMTNVTSSDIVSTPQQVKVKNDSSSSSKATKNEGGSTIHSTSEHQQHISDSPQLEISFEPSPDRSPEANDQDDNPTTNGGGDSSNKPPTTVTMSGSTSQLSHL